MAGHLVIVKRDLAVFAHVHPSGSMPMAALLLLEKQKDSGSSAMSAMPGMHETAPAEVLLFPTVFPNPATTVCSPKSSGAGYVQTYAPTLTSDPRVVFPYDKGTCQIFPFSPSIRQGRIRNQVE